MRHTVKPLLALALLWSAAPARATTPDLAQVPLEALMGMKMVKAASKFEQLISEAPAAAVVLSSNDIRAHGWRTLADALASLPGLFATEDRNYSYLGARGFLRPGDYNSRFLLMIDGVRTNDAVYDQAMIGNEGMVDMDLVQRIEFIPGAGSAVYGSSALFGVINVVTRDGNALAGTRVALGAGSAGERRVRASYGWHGQHGGDLLMSASVLTRDGESLYYPEFDTPEQNHGRVAGRDGEQARQFLFKASYGGWTVSANHVHRTKMLPTASYETAFGAPNRTMDAHGVLQLGYARNLAQGVNLAAQGLWGRADYLGHYYYATGPEGEVAPNVDGGKGRWAGLNLHATITRFAGHKIVLGADFQHDTRRDQFNFDSAPYAVLMDTRHPANRRGLFVEDEMRLGEQVLLNASLRRDRHGTGARSTSPRVALLYRFSPGNTAKLIYGRAFRVPNAYEMYYEVISEDGGQLANTALAPERISTLEAVLEHAFGASGHARLSLFSYRMRDLISQEADADSGMLVFRNIDRASARGLEASLEQVYASTARLRASYTWQRAEDGHGQLLGASPRHMAKFNGVLPLAPLRARLGAELHCLSSRLTERSRVGGYCVSNLTLSSSRLMPGADLSLSVYNLADRRYADPAGPAFVQEALARQGRSVFAKLAFGF
ncbi:TonB-dependent siderophore receptor [Massilia sp. KIM]|uniref:TonB-dependent receptor plug domain-containing protein n=1 Tax=Massilia sp. KIM TaxID=1955422 RepID=UPI001E5F6207|nr:TonB-dependent receptor [Massilia sp. KIM]